VGEGVIDIDGVVYAAAEAKISVLDRGFLYGDSAFEVMRTYGRVAFREREHLERLARSCERLRIAVPLSLDALAARVARAVEQSALPECYLRIVVTRGAGPMGLDLTLARAPSVIVYALPL
jgi:branched-chain amino acid aminotransferase